MPARAATPIRALTLLRSGVAWTRPAKVAGAVSEALGVRATALSMDRAIRPAATGHRSAAIIRNAPSAEARNRAALRRQFAPTSDGRLPTMSPWEQARHERHAEALRLRPGRRPRRPRHRRRSAREGPGRGPGRRLFEGA